MNDCNANYVLDECRPGDIDGDNVVGVPDHAGVAARLTGPCGAGPCALLPEPPAYCSILDLDGNGTVDLFDVATFQRRFGSR